MIVAMWTLVDLERAIRTSWSLDTCDPVDRADWHPDNPSRGQCGVTAMVLNDLLGGELVIGEVHVAGERTGMHYWNRFGAGIDVDLTREQFRPEESVVGGQVVERPEGPPRRCREEYELLRDRVLAQVSPAVS
jgi:hypothetical protein